MKPEPFLNPTKFSSGLNTRIIGLNIVWHPVTGSTNDDAKSLARAGAPEGTVVIAGEQQAGRGRRGRSWVAPPGSCILASVILRPAFSLPAPYYAVIACSLAVSSAVQDLCGVSALIKWPNDVVVGGKKLCGILAESIGPTEKPAIVVGFGVNVNFDPSEVPEIAGIATGLSAECGREVSCEALLSAILENMDANYGLLGAGEVGMLFERWSSRLAYMGRELYISAGGQSRLGRFEGVDEMGSAVVRWADGSSSHLSDAELSLTQLYIS